jgi:hypothetical protein
VLVRKQPDWPGLRVSQRSQADLEPLAEAPGGSRAPLRRPTVLVRELARNKSDIRHFSHFSKKRKAKAIVWDCIKGGVLSEHGIETR